MSFIPEMMIEGVSTSSLRQCIAETANTLGIQHSKALFLLIQFDWKEEELVSQLNAASKLTEVLKNSVDEKNLIFQQARCELCKQDIQCRILDCEHGMCLKCLQVHTESCLENEQVIMICPAEDCKRFINPTSLEYNEDATNEIQETSLLLQRYTEVLFKDFRLKREPVLEPEDGQHVDQHEQQAGDQHEQQAGDQHEQQAGDQHEQQLGDQHEQQLGDQHEQQLGDQHEQQLGDQHEQQVGGHPVQHLIKGVAILFATGLAGGAAVGIHRIAEWRRKHPRTWRDLMIILNLVKDGDSPANGSFWLKFFWKSKFGWLKFPRRR